MSRASEPSSAPTPHRARPVECAATFAAANSAMYHPGSLRAAALERGAGRGSRSEESGGGPGVAGREMRAP